MDIGTRRWYFRNVFQICVFVFQEKSTFQKNHLLTEQVPLHLLTKKQKHMETALLGLALPEVLSRLKELLIRKGYIVQTMNTSVIVAYQEGGWFRRQRQMVFEISTLEKNVTRIDITAIINSEKSTREEEEILEETYASAIHNSINTPIRSYGFR